MIADLTNVTVEKKDFETIKPGKYQARIKDAKVSLQKSGKSKLEVTFKIADGQDFSGREVYQNFLLEHDNPQVVEIAKQQLKSLMGALDLGDLLERVEQLHGKAVTINTKNHDYEGKTYTSVSWYERPAAVNGSAKAFSDDEIPF